MRVNDDNSKRESRLKRRAYDMPKLLLIVFRPICLFVYEPFVPASCLPSDSSPVAIEVDVERDIARSTKGACAVTAHCFELVPYSRARRTQIDIDTLPNRLPNLRMSLPKEQ